MYIGGENTNNELAVFLPIIMGILEGLLWGGFKYVLNKAKYMDTEFDPTLFFKTLLIGITLNALAMMFGVAIDDPLMIGWIEVITVFVDSLVNALIKKYKVVQSNEQIKTG